MDTVLKDLQYGIRSLLRQPAFTTVAVLTLALGIAANTATFSVINALILTPPTITDPQRVVSLWETPTDARREGYVSYLYLQDWKNQTEALKRSPCGLSEWHRRQSVSAGFKGVG
jgi:hypothetical protein